MARPTTAKLDQARIRAAALALVDAEGLERLSMRRLATALDVSAASLYFHYATKDELLEAVAADILANVDTSAFSSGWEPGVRAWARSLRAALAAHPRLVPVLSHAPGRRADAPPPPRKELAAKTAAARKQIDAQLGQLSQQMAAVRERMADYRARVLAAKSAAEHELKRRELTHVIMHARRCRRAPLYPS